MKNFEYHLPDSLDEASKLCGKPGAVARGAGIDLIDLMRSEVSVPTHLVNLTALTDPALRAITKAEDGLHIGALATLTRLIDSAEVPLVVQEAARKTATPQIRNAATVGGNLAQRPRCWYFRSPAFHCRKKGGETCYSQNGDNRYHAIFDNDECAIVHPSNLAPAFIALDARVVTSKRTLPMSELFVLPTQHMDREHALAADEIITQIVIPAGRTGGAYRDGREKTSFDWALVSTAAWLGVEGGVVKDARIVLGAVAPVPRRAAEAEAILKGQKVTPALAARAAEAALKTATPMSGNGYKLPLGRVIIKRAILAAAGLPEPTDMGG